MSPRRTYLTALLVVLIIAALCILSGCNSKVDTLKGDALSTTAYTIRGQYTVHEFHLKDGTRCVSSYHGVACDWGGSRPAAPTNFRVE